MKYTSFDGSNVSSVRTKVNEALSGLADFNLKVKAGNITYGTDHLTIKVDIQIAERDGAPVLTPEQKAYEDFRSFTNLPKLNEVVKTPYSGDIAFVGYSHKAQKYPIIYKSLRDGKQYKTTLDRARHMAGVES